MKLFAVRDYETNLYFQIEKDRKILKLLGTISYLLFDEECWQFGRWEGLPEFEDYAEFEKDGTYMGAVISKERVHLTIRGLTSKLKDEIKKLVMSKCKMIEKI